MRLQMILSRARQCMVNYSFFIMHFTVGIYHYFSLLLEGKKAQISTRRYLLVEVDLGKMSQETRTN